MRNLPLLAALLVATTATAAHADSYVAVTGLAGANAEIKGGGGALEAGLAPKDWPVALHLAVAETGGWDSSPLFDIFHTAHTGNAFQARGGLEGHLCTARDLCGYIGVDLGYERTQLVDGIGYSMDTGYVREGLVVVPRVGLDIGGKHLRFRPGFEAQVAPATLTGADATLALAYRW